MPTTRLEPAPTAVDAGDRSAGHRAPTELVVPLDGSRFAARALGVAASLAGTMGLSVMCVTCQGSDRACPVREQVRHAGLDEASVRHDARPPLDALRALVDAAPGRVVCMSSHGAGGPGRGPLGHVTDAVIRDERIPMIGVGPSCRPDWLDGGGPVLGLVDPDDVSRDVGAAGYIAAEARLWAARLGRDTRLLTVVHPDAAMSFAAHHDVEAVVSCHPAATTCSTANRIGAALVVLGAHRSSGRCSISHVLRPVLVGSTCPLYVPRGLGGCGPVGGPVPTRTPAPGKPM